MDHLDRRIIERLHRDARVTAVQMASEFNVTEGTIRRRLKNLIEQGIIRTTVVVTPRFLANHTIAFLCIKTDAARVRDVANTLSQLDVVRYVAFGTGAHNLIVEVVVESNQELFRFVNDHVAGMPGVVAIDTSIVPEVAKTTYNEAVLRDGDFAPAKRGGPLRAI
jgi:Lrp/AsnC family transcriptional regulator for asnA, asnC and gidA